ncbi:hypothetical protein [Stackebrandtia soli]|uniref:hypothetical protein n=1 Tax=Stackebrandtia soli TaxID=1892856 RepID=UPI0039EC06C6
MTDTPPAPTSVTTLRVLLWLQIGYAAFDLAFAPLLRDALRSASRVPGFTELAEGLPMTTVIIQGVIAAALLITALTLHTRHLIVVGLMVVSQIATVLNIALMDPFSTAWLAYLGLAVVALGCLGHPDTRRWLREPT